MTADVTSAAAGYVPWRGVIEQYREWLPPLPGTSPVITLGEGATPLLPAPVLSERTGCDVYLKVEGANPTGSFKDRGMTMAVSMAVSRGATAVICASTGNTSASAAAYAARAGLSCAVLVPRGKIALGKLAQALVHGAKLLQVDGPQARGRLPGRAGQLGQPGPARRPEERGVRDRGRARGRSRRALPAGRQRG
jgi:threonine synthase